MALAMANPWKHAKTGVYYLRCRVPTDLVEVVGRPMEKKSLRTKDPAEARRLHVEAMGVLYEQWANLRRGLLRPDIREAAAIAGTFYREMAERHRRGLYSPFGEPWLHRAAAEFRDNPADQSKHDAFRNAFGAKIDTGLAKLGIRLHPDATSRVDLAIARAVCHAQEKAQAVIFEGDHSPDPAADRFPPIEEVTRKGIPDAATSVDACPLDVHFAAYAKAASLAPSTNKRWGLALRNLVDLVGHDDIARFTEADIRKWIDALRAANRSPRTIRDVHLAALKALCNWMVGERKLAANPATAFRIKVPKSRKLRERDLTDEEAELVLRASLAPHSSRLGARHAAARRWVPWLAAYTGARVNELTQLRKQDVKVVSGVDIIVITPEAGTVKTGEPRSVPLHPHLIEQGFLDFVAGSRGGPLFCVERKNSSAVTPPYKKVGERLARWVRSIGVDDPNVDPFHGWRHRFKTMGRVAAIKSDVMDALQGHVPSTEGGKYGRFPISVLSRAIRRLPRYELPKP